MRKATSLLPTKTPSWIQHQISESEAVVSFVDISNFVSFVAENWNGFYTFLIGVATPKLISVLIDRFYTKRDERKKSYEKISIELDNIQTALLGKNVTFESTWSTMEDPDFHEDIKDALNGYEAAIREFNDVNSCLRDTIIREIDDNSVDEAGFLPDSLVDESVGVQYVHEWDWDGRPSQSLPASQWLLLFGYPLLRADSKDDLRSRFIKYADSHEVKNLQNVSAWDGREPGWEASLWVAKQKNQDVWEILEDNEDLFKKRQRLIGTLVEQGTRISNYIDTRRNGVLGERLDRVAYFLTEDKPTGREIRETAEAINEKESVNNQSTGSIQMEEENEGSLEYA